MNKKHQYPSLAKVIYKTSSMEELWNCYIDELRKTGDMHSMLYANKLEEFRDMKEPEKLIALEQEFNILKEHMRELKNTLNVNFRFSRRLKDFIGINEKIRLYLEIGKPLEKVRDLLGFRIVLCTGMVDTEESIKAAYELMNKILQFFIFERNCILTVSEPNLFGGFEPKEHPDVYLPKNNYLNKEFEENIKDYILNPKKKGYQGLHAILKKPDGLVFEIQIRTMAMDIRAEYGTASHGPYKNDRYEGQNITVDFSKVNMPGFAVIRDEVIYDNIGLCKSIDPFNLV